MKIKTLTLTIAIILFSCLVNAQEGNNRQNVFEFQGNVRSVETVRTYFIIDGLGANELQKRIAFEQYDQEKRLTRVSHYGNVEQRIRYDYSSGEPKAYVEYYDLNGNRLEKGEQMFKPPFADVSQKKLCPEFSVRFETDQQAKIDRSIETCSNGMHRATIEGEYDHLGRLIQYVRIDSLKRNWVHSMRYDKNGDLEEHIFRDNSAEGSTFSWRTEIREYKRDEKQNRISHFATTFHSSNASRIATQYIEREYIVYY